MDFDNFLFFFPIFGLKQPDFREKKCFFSLVVGGGFTLPTPLVVRPLKKRMCVFPKREGEVNPLALNH